METHGIVVLVMTMPARLCVTSKDGSIRLVAQLPRYLRHNLTGNVLVSGEASAARS